MYAALTRGKQGQHLHRLLCDGRKSSQNIISLGCRLNRASIRAFKECAAALWQYMYTRAVQRLNRIKTSFSVGCIAAIAGDCKSLDLGLRWFESNSADLESLPKGTRKIKVRTCYAGRIKFSKNCSLHQGLYCVDKEKYDDNILGMSIATYSFIN